jgi:hypothetical protein
MLLYDIWHPNMRGKYHDLDSNTALPAPLPVDTGALAYCTNGEGRWMVNAGSAWKSISLHAAQVLLVKGL